MAGRALSRSEGHQTLGHTSFFHKGWLSDACFVCCVCPGSLHTVAQCNPARVPQHPRARTASLRALLLFHALPHH